MRAASLHVSPFSGSWYPDDPAELRTLLDRSFEQSEQRTGRFLPPRAAGFIVPHAGIIYSGTVASATYRALRLLSPKRVVLLGFAHHGSAAGAWIADVEAFRTPLGELPVDREFAAALIATGAFAPLEEDLLCDHSVEIQLPFLQYAVPSVAVVPVYASGLDAPARSAAARALATLAGPDTALVASSDLTHFGRGFGYQPFPADEFAPDRLRELDESVLEAAGTLESGEFQDVLRSTRATVCGVQPISLLLDTVRILSDAEEVFQETLDYQTSGDITGDFRQSVSYAAAAYCPYHAFDLSRADGEALLEAARATLDLYLATGERRPLAPRGDSPAFDRRTTAFVTLHSNGSLRGCVGRRTSTEPLSVLVPSLALSAALEDSRFDSVQPGETGIELEVSILSPFKRITNPDRFRVNEHGAMLESGYHRGLLLPQVATERGWHAGQFFDALARKAGTIRDAYKHKGSRLYVFRAQIIR